MHPPGDQRRLALGHRFQEGQAGPVGLPRFRVMAGDGVVGEPAHLLRGTVGREILESAHPQVAGGHAGEDGAGQGAFAEHRLAGGHHRQGPGGGNAQGMHGLADQHLPQHGPHRRLAVAPAGEGRAPGALEGDVPAPAVAVDDFPDQQRPAVPKLGVELAELVPGVSLGDGLGALGKRVAGEEPGERRVVLAIQAQPQLLRQTPVEEQQRRRRRALGLTEFVEARQVAGIGVVEVEDGV